MVFSQLHLSYDDFFETVWPTAVNPPVYSHWQALTGLWKHEKPIRDPKNTPPKRVECPEAIIIRDASIPPSEERDEEFPMDDFPTIDEDTPTYEGATIPPLPQIPTQVVTAEASVPTRNSSRRWKTSARALESR